MIRFDNRDTGLPTKFELSSEPNWPAIVDTLRKGKPALIAYSIDHLAQDVIGLLDALEIPKAHLVGSSGDSIIAQNCGRGMDPLG